MYVGNICLNDHPNLVTNCKRVFSIHKTLHDKSIKRKTIHHFLFYVDFPLSPTLLLTDLTTRWVSNKKQELLTLREYMVISDFCGCYELLIFLVLCVVLCSVLLCLSVSYVLCTQCCYCLWLVKMLIARSILSNVNYAS